VSHDVADVTEDAIVGGAVEGVKGAAIGCAATIEADCVEGAAVGGAGGAIEGATESATVSASRKIWGDKTAELDETVYKYAGAYHEARDVCEWSRAC
jgi:hypothetical protein